MKKITKRAFISASLASFFTACTARTNYAVRKKKVFQKSSSGVYYVVEPGDTLSSISRRGRLPVQRIIKANNLSSNKIKIGQKLFLPNVFLLSEDPLRDLIRKAKKRWNVEGYTLVPRSKWSKFSVRKNRRMMGTVKKITVHHTGEHGKMATMPDIEIVRSIENYHRNTRKWAAIGYHYLIGKNGLVYEGRPSKYQGAHTRSNNKNNIGISVIGDFNKKTPNDKQLESLQSLLSDLSKKHRVSKKKIYGHRDLSTSQCPGDKLYAWVKAYKSS